LIGLIYKEAAVEGTTLGSYLIIARYNRENWNTLDRLVPNHGIEGAQEDAHKRAEEVFPEKKSSAADPGEGERSLPYPPSVQLVKTFHSNIHAQVFEQIPDILSDKKLTEEEKALWGSILDGIFRDFEPSGKNAPNTNVKDPGVGWIAMVDATRLEEFVGEMGGKDGPLWQMYDISIIPLNNDQTTDDIYKYMTPSNWRT
jgi:hypothetical protein